MIFYSKRKVDLLQQNVFVLEDKRRNEESKQEEVVGYVLVSKDVYDTAVILNERYAGNPISLRRNFVNDIHETAVEFFENMAPKPLGILGEFLELVNTDMELPLDLECLCGYLHMMSMAMDFNAYLKVPEEIRRKVDFTKNQLDAYQDAWESLVLRLHFSEIDESTLTKEFVKQLVEESVTVALQKVFSDESSDYSIKQKQRSSSSHKRREYSYSDYSDYEKEDDYDEEEEEEEISPFAGLGDLMKEMEEETAKELEEQETKEEKVSVQKVAEIVSDVTKKEASVEESKELSVIDQLIKVYGGE